MARLAGSAKLLRAMNESAALGHLLDKGALTRNDLRELTGLSKPTTSEVLRRLTEAGPAVVTRHTPRGPRADAGDFPAQPPGGDPGAGAGPGPGNPRYRPPPPPGGGHRPTRDTPGP